jgi:Fe-S-cluster containining protein
MTDPRPTTLYLPGDVRYQCTQCGICCDANLEVQVASEEAARIETLDWRAVSNLPEKAKSPFGPAREERKHLACLKTDKDCGFLDAQRLCGLHSAYGEAVKPYHCLRFPYRFVDTPDGVYTGVSFACTAVRQNIGPAIAEQESAVRQVYESRREIPRIDEPVAFDWDTKLDWKDYLLLERGIDEILSDERHSVGACLIAGHVWLGMLQQLFKQVGRTSESISEAVRFYTEKTREDQYSQAFRVAKRPAAHHTLKRMLLGTFTSFGNVLPYAKTRIGAALRVFWFNGRHWMRWGGVRLTPFEQSVPYRDFAPRPEFALAPAAQDLLRRYFRHAVFRKDLVVHTDMFWGYCFLVMSHGLLEWYVAVMDALGKVPDPEHDPTRGVSGALEHVERLFVFHSRFRSIFLYHPALADTFQRVFRKPNFAHTIVMG